MPVAMLQMTPGGTGEEYERLGEKIFGVRSDAFSVADAPDGLIIHTAGPTDDGWFVYDVWETVEQLQEFAQNRMLPALAELGISDPPPPRIFEIHNLVLPASVTAG